jgi:Spy/CpxP family protein refolding chaperone
MKDGFESLGRVRLQGIALLAIAFVVGALGGMAAERVRAARTGHPAPMEQMGMHGAFPRAFDELHLTPDQEERIQAIFRAHRPRTDSVLRASLPRLHAIQDSVRAQIRAVLTPDQQRQFDDMETRSPRGRRGPRGGPGFGPPSNPSPDSGPLR